MGIWLIFFLVCFAGMGFMFFCILRRQDALLKAMRDEHEQFKVLLRALASRFDVETESRPLSDMEKQAPLFVDEALDAYARQERQDKKNGLPDLKL